MFAKDKTKLDHTTDKQVDVKKEASDQKQYNLFDAIFKQSNEYWKSVSEKMSDSEYESWILNYVSNDAPHWDNRDVEVVMNFVNENTDDESKHIKPDVDDIGKLYCLCRKPESGDMIACDNLQCPKEWSHFECVRISEAPIDDWFCE